MKRSSPSASIGYTHPGSTFGLTSTIDRHGLSTSAELTGVSIATNGPNGFQMDEINFAEQNINAAQDTMQDDPSNRDKNDDRSMNADADDNDFFRDMGEAGIALAGLLAGGAGIVTCLFGGGTPVASGGNANPLPTNAGVVATDDPVRRREDEEGGEVSEADLSNNPLQDSTNSKGMDQINTFDGESNSEAGVGGFEGPVFDSDVDGRSYDPLDGEKGGGDARVYDRAELKALTSSQLNKLVAAGIGNPIGELKKASDSDVITKTSTVTSTSTALNPAKIKDIKTLNEKVDVAIKEKLNNAGKTHIDKAIVGDVVKALSNDPTFRKLTETQLMRDSRTQYEKAIGDIQTLNDRFKGDQGEVYKKELEPLIAKLKTVEANYQKELASYQENIRKAIEKRDAGGNIKVEMLKNLAPDLTLQVRSTKLIETRYEIYRDSEGNEVLVSSSNRNSLDLVRNAQDVFFNQTIRDLPGQLQLSDSGLITRDLNGNVIALEDTTSRKLALAKLKAALGDKFDSTNNPNFAKLEAVNSAQAFWEGGKIAKITTNINGIDFQTSGNSTDLNFKAIQNSDGSTWRDVANAVKEIGGSEVVINSIVRPNSSHSEGNALDIGAIRVKDPNGKIKTLELSFDRTSKTIPEIPPNQLRAFLDKISETSSIGFVAHPWEVRMGGVTYPNVFSSVRSDLWEKGNIGDPKSLLSRTEIEEIYRVMGSQPNITFDPNTDAGRDIMTQMWNHRHHLHVSETR